VAQAAGLFLTMKKSKISQPELQTWDGLNAAVMATTDEKYLMVLLQKEQAGRARKQFLRRIHSRLNKVRADRERLELEK
jgi:hypothetical protein